MDIKEVWILVTCSGTIGRTTIALTEWDGWAASQHSLRIIPNPESPCPSGYLSAFLSSSIGQAQLTAQIYGAVVDELTEKQARAVIVPVPRTKEEFDEVKAINDLTMKSSKKKSEAVRYADQAQGHLSSLIPAEEKPENDGLTAFERFQNLAQKALTTPRHSLSKVAAKA